jgi:pyrroloquinoline quinone (PQQ) biosynthesis protein C
MPRGPELDELRFFSLDLMAGDASRVKVYGFHHRATIDDLLRVIATAPGSDAAAVRRYCATLVGGDGAIVASRQPATCLAFVGDEPRPKTGTVHVPVRSFAGDDATAQARVAEAMRSIGVSPAPFAAAVGALAARPLEEGSGLVAWAAIRTGAGPAKANVYLAPKALADEATHAGAAPSRRPDDPEAVVRQFEQATIASHPFFRRIEREPFDHRPLALLVWNIREAISLHFARRLASVVARIDEDPIRSLLAKQLNDELGDGDPSRTHKLLFERFAAGLAPKLPEAANSEQLEPGRAFGAVQEELYTQRSPYEGLGATLVMELLGKQADLTLGKLLRRSATPLPDPVMEWLVLHEELELAHVDESFELARMIPPGRKSVLAVRGAEELARAGWAFLDDLYDVCFAA